MKSIVGRYTVGLVACAVGTVACSGAGAPVAGVGADAGVSPVILVNGTNKPDLSHVTHVSQTEVHLNADGTKTVRSRMISVAKARDERARHVARRSAPSSNRFKSQETASEDDYCEDSSLWLYTQEDGNDPNPGAEICFYAAGTGSSSGSPAVSYGPSAYADLSEYTFEFYFEGTGPYIASWNGEVESYWAGAGYGGSSGCLAPDYPYNTSAYDYVNFYVGDDLAPDTDDVEVNYVYLNQICCNNYTGYTNTCDANYNSVCYDFNEDVDNCGSCGNACPAESTCASGECACYGGLAMCEDGCDDLLTDANDCGACGNDITGDEYTKTCDDGTACVGNAEDCDYGNEPCCGTMHCDQNDSGSGPAFWCGS